MKYGKITHRFTAILAVIMLLALAVMAIPLVPNGTTTVKAQSTTAPIPDYTGLTKAHSWAVDSSTPKDTSVTIDEPIYNASAQQYSNITYIEGENRTYANITLKELASGYSEETLKAKLPYKPGVHTVTGELKVPEQHGIYAGKNYIDVKVSLAGGAVTFLRFTLAPGVDDQVYLTNGTAGAGQYYDIPRIPRGEWVNFIISEKIESGYLCVYYYIHGEDYTFSNIYYIAQGPALEDWFNLWVASSGSKIDVHLSLDNVTWYTEYYSLPKFVQETTAHNVYYKGFSWMDYVFAWEYANWSANSTDIDIVSNYTYCTFFDYVKYYTVQKGVVILDPSQDYNWDINHTLSNSGLTEIVYRVGSTSDYDPILRAISWNKEHNKNGDKIIGASLRDTSSMWGYSNWTVNYTHLKNQLDTYANDIPLFVDIYFVHMEDMDYYVWQLVDGVFLTGWYMEDYANLKETVAYAREKLGDEKPMWVVGYTHDYGRHEPMSPKFEEYVFQQYHDLIVNKDIDYVGIMGPARFNNYPDHKEINEWYAKQMAVDYDASGTNITLYKQGDGKSVNITHIDIPALTETNELEVNAHLSTEIELEVPGDWDMDKVHVVDTETGKEVDWSEGSVIFNTTSGHEYKVYVEVPSGGFWILEETSNFTTFQWVMIGILAFLAIATIYVWIDPHVNVIHRKKHHRRHH